MRRKCSTSKILLTAVVGFAMGAATLYIGMPLHAPVVRRKVIPPGLNLTEVIEAQYNDLLDRLEAQQAQIATLKAATTDTPIVLTQWLGATKSTLKRPRFLSYNRKDGTASLTGERRHSLKYTPLRQVGSTVDAFWGGRMETYSDTNVPVKPSSLIRYLTEQGTGPNIEREAPYFFPDTPFARCRPILTLDTTPDTYIYISKTGRYANFMDPSLFHKVHFNDTAALFVEGQEVHLAIAASYAEKVAARFNVTLTTQVGAVAIDIAFTGKGIFGPLSLNKGNNTAYEVINAFAC